MSSPVTILAQYKVSPEHKASLLELIKEMAIASRQEPGCMTYLPYESASDPDSIFIYEVYRDQQAVEEHRNSEHFQRIVIPSIIPLLKERTVHLMLGIV